MPNDLNTILVEDHTFIQVNGKEASAAITPGMICERDSNGKFKPHGGADAPWGGWVACEDELQGNTIDDDYASGGIVRMAIVRRGDRVNMILRDDETVEIGDKLVSNGDGTLKLIDEDSSGKYDYEDNTIVGEADEALDLGTSSGKESSALTGNQRIVVRIW